MTTPLKTYFALTKPGIIYGNLLSALGGFFLASSLRLDVDLLLLPITLLGIALVIGSACVVNNILDRDIDRKMSRTKSRALATGQVTKAQALTFAIFLGLAGAAVLIIGTNLLTFGLGLIGFFVYVVLYTLGKRHFTASTLVGSISGAMPAVAGYTAATNQFDTAAILLFLIMAFWQMPHFYAIAVFRLKDYEAADVPVLPAKRGVVVTKWRMLLYTLLFTAACVSLTLFGYTGITFAVIMGGLGLGWLVIGVRSLDNRDDVRWARRMFLLSLIILLMLSAMLAVGALLP